LGVKRTSPSRLESMSLAARKSRDFSGSTESQLARLDYLCAGHSSQLAGVKNPVAITRKLHHSRWVHVCDGPQVVELNGAQGRGARIHTNQTHELQWETPSIPCVPKAFCRHVSHQNASSSVDRSNASCVVCGKQPSVARGQLSRCIPCITAEAARARDAREAAEARVSKSKSCKPRTENA